MTSHSFSASAFEKKLKSLNSSLQSIQGTAQWLIHYRKNAKTVVHLWYKELQNVDSDKKLTLLYLANDVIQNSKKKGAEYKNEFVKLLPRALQLVTREKKDSLQKSVERIVSVWEERKVFEQDVIVRFKTILVAGSLKPHRRTKSESDLKRARSEAKRSKLEKRRDSEEDPPNDRNPPEPEELIRRVQAIGEDKSALRDITTRQKIASFPPEIHDPTLLSQVKDKVSAEDLAKKVDDAVEVLKEYNKRLEGELEERNEVQEMLDSFIWQQKTLLRNAKKNLKDYQMKMEQVISVKEELKSHLANLPDFSQLPAGSNKKGSLAPLPAVGDLFN